MFSKRQEKKIDRYVDSVRALRALLDAEKWEGKTEDRTRLIKAAKVQTFEDSRCLTGAMLELAMRMLSIVSFEDAERATAEEENGQAS